MNRIGKRYPCNVGIFTPNRLQNKISVSMYTIRVAIAIPAVRVFKMTREKVYF